MGVVESCCTERCDEREFKHESDSSVEQPVRRSSSRREGKRRGRRRGRRESGLLLAPLVSTPESHTRPPSPPDVDKGARASLDFLSRSSGRPGDSSGWSETARSDDSTALADKLESMWNKYDTNGNGWLDETENRAMVTELYVGLQAVLVMTLSDPSVRADVRRRVHQQLATRRSPDRAAGSMSPRGRMVDRSFDEAYEAEAEALKQSLRNVIQSPDTVAEDIMKVMLHHSDSIYSGDFAADAPVETRGHGGAGSGRIVSKAVFLATFEEASRKFLPLPDEVISNAVQGITRRLINQVTGYKTART